MLAICVSLYISDVGRDRSEGSENASRRAAYASVALSIYRRLERASTPLITLLPEPNIPSVMNGYRHKAPACTSAWKKSQPMTESVQVLSAFKSTRSPS